MEVILKQLESLTPKEPVSNQDEKNVLDLLKQLTITVKKSDDEENRSKLTLDDFKLIQSFLENGTVEVTNESLRFLRNVVAFCPRNQNIIFESTNLLPWAGQFLVDNKEITSTKICLQFLINCIVGSQQNAELVASTATYIPRYLSEKIGEAGFLLNTILILQPNFSNVIFTDSSVFQIILENPDIDSNVILLETLASNLDFLNLIYTQLPETQQLTYIQFLSASQCKINLEFFVSLFKSKADSILKSKLDKLQTEFQEITSLLSLISSSNQIDDIRDDKPLVTTVTHLLQLTNQSLLFNPVEKLSQVTEEHKNHPTFLFKANLIRLLGNLAHDHPDNQNTIGESCLHLILNCTRIDALNPFITQWSILAIRNLLHKNPKNQSMVSNLKLQSSAYSKVLSEEFGINVQVDVEKNTVRITPATK